jgi:6-pyruvoyltetrahydropterin/6-carboxytetrahydropterin synthase
MDGRVETRVPGVRVAREFEFQAAHQLPEHPGRCRRLHGHSYRMQVVCRAPVDPRTGIAIDFGEIERVVGERVLGLLDHAYLNEILPTPSAENIAAWAWERLSDAGLPLDEIVLYETAGCFVAYRGRGADGVRGPGGHGP